MRETLTAGWYRVVHVLVQGVGVSCWQIRAIGRHRVPRRGGVILASNHQSFLDPVLVGVALRRRPRFLARESLFRHAPFAWLIRSLGAVAIQRDAVGAAGVRRCVELLGQGQVVLMFPEGTRTRDGEVGTVRPGVALIARRARVPVVPVTICGAYEVWPRHRPWLGLGRIEVRFGEPIPPETCARLGARELAGVIQRRLSDGLSGLRRRYHRRR